MKRADLKIWSIKELKDHAQELYTSIEIVDCFSIGDLTLYDWVLNELALRGIEITENKKLEFTEAEVE